MGRSRTVPRTNGDGEGFFVTLWRSLWMAVLSAAVFACMAGRNLEAPGLYYDEVHQVLPAFAWLGSEPGHFSLVPIGGVPWLTTTYSGAIKSALFAAFLEVTGAEFSVATWRWFGIALVVVGWIWCCAAIGLRWGPIAQLAFGTLLLTDTTVLLTTRHDWGPTALALSLRCAFLAVWLRTDGRSTGAAFALGSIAGLSFFEKLSSVVLLAPLAFALSGRPRRAVAAGLLGFCVGSLPLAIVNLTTWSSTDGPISFSNLADGRTGSLLRFVWDFLSLGQGDWVRHWVVDLPLARPFVWGELAVITALVVLGCVERESRPRMMSYLAIGAALLMLPRRTQAHHWIIGTPFHYVAVAILVARPGRFRVPATVLLLLLLVLRLPVVGDTARAIAAGRTAPRFDPAQTRVAKFLASQADALVVASTWGIANQIICFAQGRKDAVYEPIYEDDEVDAFAQALAHTERSRLYLAEVPREAHLFAARTARVRAAITSDARWREVDADAEIQESSVVRVRKFVRQSR
jgi:hypothetical protein